jgi:hypothetical protein
MEKGDTIPKYLTKFVQCRDELGSVGIIVTASDFVIRRSPCSMRTSGPLISPSIKVVEEHNKWHQNRWISLR